MNPASGTLLVSAGNLYDRNFRHTVVLVGEHTKNGALGVILNRALDLTVEDGVPPLASLVLPGDCLYQGGPVQPASPVVVAEFVDPTRADIPIFGSVGFLVGEVPADIGHQLLQALVFAGYSGWAPGQLEEELEADSWILDPARVDDVFTDAPDLLWSRVLQRKGPEYHQLSKVHFDPTMN